MEEGHDAALTQQNRLVLSLMKKCHFHLNLVHHHEYFFWYNNEEISVEQHRTVKESSV